MHTTGMKAWLVAVVIVIGAAGAAIGAAAGARSAIDDRAVVHGRATLDGMKAQVRNVAEGCG